MISASITKNALVLGFFAVATAGLLATVNQQTEQRILDNQKKALQASLYEIVPADSGHDNELLNSTVIIQAQELAHKKPQTVYLATKNGQAFAAVFPINAPEGYGGTIRLLIGIYIDGSIAGVRVIPPHKETPGLGDKIELKKSDWILSFNGKSLDLPAADGWAVKKDGGEFDAFTGATITPRAIINSVYKALQYFSVNKFELFNQLTQAQKTNHTSTEAKQ